MPVCFAECDKDLIIREIKGSDKIKKHLQNLGFIVGETIQLVSIVNDNVILKIKGVTLAVSRELAIRVII